MHIAGTEDFTQHDLGFFHAAHDVGLHVIGNPGGGKALKYAWIGITRARTGCQSVGNFKLWKHFANLR
jgi:hypothetical protein